MTSAATTDHGDGPSSVAPVILSANPFTSRSWISWGVMPPSGDALGRLRRPDQAAELVALLAEHAVLLDLLLQLHHAIEQRLGPRRAAGHVDVHRHHLVDALQHVVAVLPVGPAVVGARAHRDHVLRLG